jgi:hypothetical protein
MRKCFFSLLTALSIFVASAAEAPAAPVNAAAFAAIAAARDAASPVQEALLQSLFGPVHTLGQMRAPLASGVPPPKGLLLQSPHGPVFTLGKLLALKFSLAPR